MTIQSKSFSQGGPLADICTQQSAGLKRPIKNRVMIRICFTAIAYIISFLSHSNELTAAGEGEACFEEPNQAVHVIQQDSLREEKELNWNDLN